MEAYISATSCFRSSSDGQVIVLHISDTHNNLPTFDSLHPADILIHTGDFSKRGTPEEFALFNDWLGSIASQYPVRVVVLGNHDCTTFRDDYCTMRNLLSNATHVPGVEMVEILGLRCLMFPWFRDRKGAAIVLNQEIDRCEGTHIDIFASHIPAQGIRDRSYAGNSCGSKKVYKALQRCRPLCHLFGHVHETYGYSYTYTGENDETETLSINSSLCDHPVVDIVRPGHLLRFTVGEERKEIAYFAEAYTED